MATAKFPSPGGPPSVMIVDATMGEQTAYSYANAPLGHCDLRH